MAGLEAVRSACRTALRAAVAGERALLRIAGGTRASWQVQLWLAMLELLPSRRKARFGDLDYDWEHSVDTTRSNVGFRTQLLTGSTARPYFASEPWLFEEIMEACARFSNHS